MLRDWIFKALLFLAIVSSVGALGLRAGQQTRPISVEDALRTRSFGEDSSLALSPDGTQVAYMIRENQRIDSKKLEGIELYLSTGAFSGDLAGDIWITNTASGETRSLTNNEGSSWEPTWSPDGNFLAFLSNRDGSGQARLWVWSARENRLSRVSELNVRAIFRRNRIEWTPDSKQILITTVPESLSVEEYAGKLLRPAKLHDELATAAPGSSVVVYRAGGSSSGPEQSADPAMSNLELSSFHDLVCLNALDGKIAWAIRGRKIEAYRISPDGAEVAFSTPKRFEKYGSWQRVYDLTVIDVQSLNARTILSDQLLDGGFSWSPDGSRLGYRACNAADNGCNYFMISHLGGPQLQVSRLNGNHFDGWEQIPLWDKRGDHFYFLSEGALWRAGLSSNSAIELSRLPGRKIILEIEQSPGMLWTPDDGASTVVITHDPEGKQDGFYKIDLRSGRETRLLEQAQCYTCKWPIPISGSFVTSVSREKGRLVYVAEDAGQAPDLWVTEADFRKPRRLTQLNPQFTNYQMGSGRLIEWLDDEGDRRKSALLLPPDYRVGQKYPLLVWVYLQRPISDRIDEFGLGEYPGPLNMQLFATRGFVVLLPDGRSEPENPALGVAKSVLPAVNKVIEMGIADPERVGVMGHSAGGYCALALLVQTRRFKVAIEADGFGDFGSAYGIMQKDGSGFLYGVAERLLGVSPWQNPFRYVQNSPFYSLDRVETPLLIVHGEEDDAAASFLAGQIFVGLRRLNKEVEYAEYRREGHVPRDWAYANQLDVANRVLSWLEKYLKPGML